MPRRLGEPQDIARMAVWLLRPENNWVTGRVFRIDGGLGTVRPFPSGRVSVSNVLGNRP
jgi:NAD(P)-dependent dehydrogenase (short-subunit alcohol dehydrogenase family)